MTVAPVGKISFPNETATTTYAVTKCTEEARGGMPDWVTVPATNLSEATCHSSDKCQVEFGKLPLQAAREETLSFTLYRDLFGDVLKGFGLGGLSIGDTLIIYCSHPGIYFTIFWYTAYFTMQVMSLTRQKTLSAIRWVAWLRSVWKMLAIPVCPGGSGHLLTCTQGREILSIWLLGSLYQSAVSRVPVICQVRIFLNQGGFMN